jgi:hypothetical protein
LAWRLGPFKTAVQYPARHINPAPHIKDNHDFLRHRAVEFQTRPFFLKTSTARIGGTVSKVA